MLTLLACYHLSLLLCKLYCWVNGVFTIPKIWIKPAKIGKLTVPCWVLLLVIAGHMDTSNKGVMAILDLREIEIGPNLWSLWKQLLDSLGNFQTFRWWIFNFISQLSSSRRIERPFVPMHSSVGPLMCICWSTDGPATVPVTQHKFVWKANLGSVLQQALRLR